MNRPLIITIGIVIIFVVIGVWVYLLLFGGMERTQDIFSNFTTETDGEVTVREVPSEDGDVIPTAIPAGETLTQLTQRPVAGFVVIENVVRYVEKGTGHVYAIDLRTGTETQLSRTTVPNTDRAIISPEGTNIVFISTADSFYSIGTVLNQTIELYPINLPSGIDNITFKTENQLLYSYSSQTHTIGHTLTLLDGKITTVFTLPFADANLLWGPAYNNRVYAYPKISRYLEGALYEVDTDTLSPLTNRHKGFSAFMNQEWVLSSSVRDERFVSTSLSLETGEEVTQAIAVIPEKCTFGTKNSYILWCAAPIETPGPGYQENWYRGVGTNKDLLWKIDIETTRTEVVSPLEDMDENPIDVAQISITNNGALVMINRTDSTLWRYSPSLE